MNEQVETDTTGDMEDALPPFPLVSKAIPPCVPDGHLPRERITKLLEQGLHHGMTLVSAAEGFGKTTALVDWHRILTSKGIRTVWFTVDEDDVNPRRFWMNFRYALRLSQKDAVSRPRESSETSLAALWELANDLSLTSSSQNPIVFIIENFDALEGSETMTQFMQFANALSSNIHLYLSSRILYTKHDFSHAHIVDIPFGITSDMLSCTRRETAGVVRAILGEQVDEPTLDIIFERTRGWLLAIKAATTAALGNKDALRSIADFPGHDDRLWEFFAREVFDPLDDRTRRFLLSVSTLRRFNAHLCDYMLDSGDSDRMIQWLFDHNILITPLDARREWFELHPLFYEWLEYRAADLCPMDIRLLNLRAARWFLRHGMTTAAAKHQILATERDDILNLVRAAYPDIPLDACDRMVRDRSLSDDPRSLSPEFCLLASWAYILAVNLGETAEWVARTRTRAQEDNDGVVSEGLQLSLEVIEVKSACLSNNFDAGIQLGDHIAARLNGEQYLPLRIMLTNCYAESYDQQGMLLKGMDYHRKMAAAAEGYAFTSMASINDYEIAFSLLEQGKLKKAQHVCHSLMATYPSDYSAYAAAETLDVFAEALRGDVEGGRERLERTRGVLSPRRNIDMYLDWCVVSAWVHALKGNTDEGDLTLLEASELLKAEPTPVPRGSAPLPFLNRAVIGLLAGDPASARAIHEEFMLTRIQDTAYSLLAWDFVEWRCRWLEGGYGDGSQLEDMLVRSEACGFGLLSLEIRLEIALWHFQTQKRAKAFPFLRDALIGVLPDQPIAPFTCRKKEIRPLIASYLEAASPDYAQRAFARRLLRRPEMQPDGDSHDADSTQGHGTLDLTTRETEVLRMAAMGMSRADMAEELCVSDNTVKSHLSHLYGKFGVHRFKDLLAQATDQGYV